MLSREELIRRGARFKDGSKVEEIKHDPIPSAPLVAEQRIDTAPIAEAVSKLSDVVKTAIEAQRPILEKIAEKQAQPVEKKTVQEAWEFTIQRDSRGRIETIKATAMT